jgi:hypothetical protein
VHFNGRLFLGAYSEVDKKFRIVSLRRFIDALIDNASRGFGRLPKYGLREVLTRKELGVRVSPFEYSALQLYYPTVRIQRPEKIKSILEDRPRSSVELMAGISRGQVRFRRCYFDRAHYF